jgi:hypothetical protein
MEVVYSDELPQGVLIKIGNTLFAGIGKINIGADDYERLCSQTGK